MYHDSFADDLIPFLSDNFGRSVYITWKKGVDTSFIEEEKPAVVILEYTERYFYHLLDPIIYP
jgi:hypothetical protein